MASGMSTLDLIRLLPKGGPAILNVSVTNVCNATCDFCNFAHDKGFVKHRVFLDAARWQEALGILHERALVRFVTFMGGEPLLHPKLPDLARAALALGVQPTFVTNGFNLPDRLAPMLDAGVGTVFVSIDAADAETHERNRGLKGVIERIRAATATMAARGVVPIASVAMTRLVPDYAALARSLVAWGFQAVTFSYPRRAPLGSSSLVYSEDSALVDMSNAEIVAAIDQVEAVRTIIPVHNPQQGLADLRARLTGQPERFVCHAGYKYFYLDWNYALWRCEDWAEPLCDVWDFSPERLVRDGCQACSTDCYRDASIVLQAPIALGDAFARARAGKLGAAVAALADRRNLGSVAAIAGHGKRLRRLAGVA